MNQGYHLNETFTTTPSPTTNTPENVTFPPYNVVDKQGSSVIDKPGVTANTAQDSCGVQIYSGDNFFLAVVPQFKRKDHILSRLNDEDRICRLLSKQNG